MFRRSQPFPAFGRRLAASVAALLIFALLLTNVSAQPVDAVHPVIEPQTTLTTQAVPAALPLMEPLSPPAGALDPTFDGDGAVMTGFFSTTGQASAVAIQSDGKIVVAGYALNGSSNDFALARYTGDSSLDASFDGDGKVTTDFFGLDDQATAVAIQSDGKIVVAGYVVNSTTYTYDFAVARYSSDGSLDASFDSDGIVVSDIAGSTDKATAVAVQSDGKIVVAGYARNGSYDDFAVARYSSDGSLDTSFDSDGTVMTDIAGSTDNATAVAIQSDGKIVVAGYAYNSTYSYDFAVARYSSDGSLDTSFDGDGKVTTDFLGSYDFAKAVAIQSDGKIVVAGYVVNSSYTYDFAVARYSSDGSLDTAFDGDGIITTDIAGLTDIANAVAIQSDGKIVVAGYALNGSYYDFAVARYSSDGSLDTSFDSDGTVVTDLSGLDDNARAVAIQSDGKIVVAGSASNSIYGPNFALARYSSNGSLDTAFDGDGTVMTGFFSLPDQATAVAIQSDGKIVVAGYAYNNVSEYDFAVARYSSDGSLDTSFDSDGTVMTDFLGLGDFASAVAIQSDGKIVVAGYANNGSTDAFALARYSSNGLLDTAFDGDGTVMTGFFSWDDSASAVAIQSDGKIVVAGYASNNGSYYDFAVARYSSDGSLDASFDGDGTVTTDFFNSTDSANAVAIQSDGKIVVAGYAYNNGSYYDFAVARYSSDGSLDTSFDSDGKVTTAIGSLDDIAKAVAIQSDGKIVVAGYALNSSTYTYDFAVARYTSDGSLDTSFDGDGTVMTDFLGSYDIANAVAIQSDGKIVVAGYAYNSTYSYDFAVARYSSDGSLDTAFDSDGIVTTDFLGSYDIANAVAIQSDGKIVVAGYVVNSSYIYDFAVARYSSDGSLDTTFDGDGIITTDIAGSTDITTAVAIQSDGKIVVAGNANNGSTDAFALARYTGDGSLDTAFDSDGKVMTDLSGSVDSANAVAIQSDGKIVVAGMARNGFYSDFAVARYQVASTSSQVIAANGSATLEGVAITNHSGTSCTLTVTKYPTPPGGRPADINEMPVHWQISTDCTTYTFDLVFSYTDTELLFGNNVTEAALKAYRSSDGTTYTLAGGAVDTAANTVTVTGVTQLSRWGLIGGAPLAITLTDFRAAQQGGAVLASWETASELNNRGFSLYRSTDPTGPDRQLNAALIPSQSSGNPQGFVYTWEDRADLTSGVTYYYWVEDVNVSGAATLHGPVSVAFQLPTAVTLSGISAAPAPLPVVWVVLLVLGCATALLAVHKRFAARG